MSETTTATPTGAEDTSTSAAKEAVEARTGPLSENPRNSAMDAIAARRAAELATEATPASEAEAVAEPAAKEAVADLSIDAQIGKQGADGKFILDEATLARAMVRQKVDGVETLVPAEQVFRSSQKDVAADVRLAKATDTLNKAQAILADAQLKADAITAATTKKGTEAEKIAANAATDEVIGSALNLMYEGKQEEAAAKLNEAISLAVKSMIPERGSAATPDMTQLVQQTTSQVRQQMNLDGALVQLFVDYPEIKTDPDYVALTDLHVNRLVAEGKDQPTAIAEAGAIVGEKFKLGKFGAQADAGRSGEPKTPTTQAEKLAAKQRLDEPAGTAARAVTTVPAPQTRSDVIAEMRASRATSSAL